MIGFFNKHKKWIFIATTAIFLAGIFVGLGGYLFSGSVNSNAVAMVGKTAITADEFYRTYDTYLDAVAKNGKEITDAEKEQIKDGLLNEMIVKEIFAQSAEKYKMIVTDGDIAQYIQDIPAFHHEGKFNREIYERVLNGVMRLSPAQFEAQLKKDITALRFQDFLISLCKVAPTEAEQTLKKMGVNTAKLTKDKEFFTATLRRAKAMSLITYYVEMFSKENKIDNILAKKKTS